jgi:hypothetical protein
MYRANVGERLRTLVNYARPVLKTTKVQAFGVRIPLPPPNLDSLRLRWPERNTKPRSTGSAAPTAIVTPTAVNYRERWKRRREGRIVNQVADGSASSAHPTQAIHRRLPIRSTGRSQRGHDTRLERIRFVRSSSDST